MYWKCLIYSLQSLMLKFVLHLRGDFGVGIFSNDWCVKTLLTLRITKCILHKAMSMSLLVASNRCWKSALHLPQIHTHKEADWLWSCHTHQQIRPWMRVAADHAVRRRGLALADHCGRAWKDAFLSPPLFFLKAFGWAALLCPHSSFSPSYLGDG